MKELKSRCTVEFLKSCSFSSHVLQTLFGMKFTMRASRKGKRVLEDKKQFTAYKKSRVKAHERNRKYSANTPDSQKEEQNWKRAANKKKKEFSFRTKLFKTEGGCC